MMKIVVIGYGNLLRRDDGVGILAVEMLQKRIQHEAYRFVTQRQPYPETVTLLEDAAVVVFVDACVGETPGEIHSTVLIPHESRKTDSHHTTLEWLLGMCQELYGHTPQAMLFTITGQDFNTGEGLSDVVRQQLPELVEAIETCTVGMAS